MDVNIFSTIWAFKSIVALFNKVYQLYPETCIELIGTLICTFITGLFTFLALFFTIKNENRKTSEERKAIEKRRTEDLRNSVFPLLVYSVQSTTQEPVERVIPSSLIYSSKDEPLRDGITIYPDIKEKVTIKNVGKGPAIRPRLLKVIYDDINRFESNESDIVIAEKEEAYIVFNICSPKIERIQDVKFWFKIGYFDILNNYYSQDICLDFLVGISLLNDKSDVNLFLEGMALNEQFTPKIDNPENYIPYKMKISVQDDK